MTENKTITIIRAILGLGIYIAGLLTILAAVGTFGRKCETAVNSFWGRVFDKIKAFFRRTCYIMRTRIDD